MQTGRRGSGGAGERVNIADSTRRGAKGRKREGRFEAETRTQREAGRRKPLSIHIGFLLELPLFAAAET